jgi:integrase
MKDYRLNEKQIAPERKSARVHLRPVQFLSPEQARDLLVTAKEQDHEVLLMLALVLGLRSGELLALQWQAIDWESGSLRVSLTRPVAYRSADQPVLQPVTRERMILLPRTVRDRLQEHALCQQQERKRVGVSWQSQDLVLSASQGHSLSPARLTFIVQDLLRLAHLPVLRFHELRHSTASLLLLSGIAPEMVRIILGLGMRWAVECDQLVPFSREHLEQARQAMEQFFFES